VQNDIVAIGLGHHDVID